MKAKNGDRNDINKFRKNLTINADKDNDNNEYYAAIDLGTNSCRLVIAQPTPSAFHVVETFSRITRLGEDIIHGNMLTKSAIHRTIAAKPDPAFSWTVRHFRIPS